MTAKSKQRGDTHERLADDGFVKGSSDRSFGIVFAVVFLLIALGPIVTGGSVRWWSLAVALVFGVLAAIRPGLLAPINRLWLGLGLLLNRIVSPLVMALLFYLIITPFAFFMRLTGKDPLRLKYDPEVRSYWIARVPPGPPPETITNQY
jgi:predicted membrane metal-binding protein